MNTSLFHFVFYLPLNSSVSILREDSLLLKKVPPQSLVKSTGKTMPDGNEKLCLLNQVSKLSCLWRAAFLR